MRTRLTAALLLTLGLVLAAALAADFDAIFRRHGAAHGVDWRLLKAIAQVESSLNPRAEHPNGLSSGLMQIYCAPAHARDCANRFDIADWPPASRAQLYDADYNTHLAAQILAWNLRTYGLRKGIAVYNHWGARRTPPGQPFPNQRYVDAVLARYHDLAEKR